MCKSENTTCIRKSIYNSESRKNVYPIPGIRKNEAELGVREKLESGVRLNLQAKSRGQEKYGKLMSKSRSPEKIVIKCGSPGARSPPPPHDVQVALPHYIKYEILF